MQKAEGTGGTVRVILRWSAEGCLLVPSCSRAPFLAGQALSKAQFKEVIPIQGPGAIPSGCFSDENVTSRGLKSEKRGHEAGSTATRSPSECQPLPS